MTEFQVGDRVRVAVEVLPEGGPAIREGAEGTVTEGNHRHPKFPSVGEFVGVDFDDPSIANGDMLARRLERVTPRPSDLFPRTELPSMAHAVAVAARITENASERLDETLREEGPEPGPEPASGDSVQPDAPFPVGARVVILKGPNAGDFGTVTELRGSLARMVSVDDQGEAYFYTSGMARARVYVSGPMTGYPEYNFPEFNEWADILRNLGWEVENPADKGIVEGWGWEEYLRYDVRAISDCHAIFTLENWQESPGANLEMIVAHSLGLKWLNPDGFVPDPNMLAERVPALAPWSGATPSETEPTEDATIRPNGEVRVKSSTGGEKGSKPARFDLVPAGPLWQVAELYGKGAEKYAPRNWERGYDWSLSFAAMMRHAWAFWNGEDIDPETEKPHMASVVFHAFALLQFMESNREFDNRPTTVAAD